jgi:hypothetical protein
MLAAALATPAIAQDFAFDPGAGPAVTPSAFLERGLPPARAGLGFEAASARWMGVEGWSTAALAGLASLGPACLAAGVSRTGDAALGWHSVGVALGARAAHAGAALRALGRRDRAEQPGPLDAVLGAEAGGGAWARAGEAVELWASAPQLWTGGVGPPLARALEIGGAVRAGDVRVWVAHGFARRAASMTTRRSAGAALTAPSGSIALHVRERPLRGGASACARAGAVRAGVGVESHPALGEIWSLSLAWIGGGR